MPRQKGFKLSDEQKKRMQAGRKAAKAKKEEGLIQPLQQKVKKEEGVKIIGYMMDKGEGELPYPIFKGEGYKGKMYDTIEEARHGR